MPLVAVDDLAFHYGRGAPGPGTPWTIDGVGLTIEAGSAVGIVGESGSGKSTLIRILTGLLPPGRGTVTFDGRDSRSWLSTAGAQFRRRNQMVFQSPANSFDPRMRLGSSVAEPTRALERRKPTTAELEQWMHDVGLNADHLRRYPHQLSGGQLQRVAIARALSVRPDVLYADEPTSALDVSVQAQVLNLLIDLRKRFGLTLVLVSHDLAVVGRVCEQIVVMHRGRIVEAGSARQILLEPSDEYTKRLVAAATAVRLTTPAATGAS